VEKLSEIMIASTSHDMRTPLNTIINMLLLIEARVNENNFVSGAASNSVNSYINEEHLKKWVRIASNSTQLL
jgi:signal transduction histidine kinase